MPRVLTGIKPTGSVHLGNYFGAIAPALAQAPGSEAFFFIADAHALNQGLAGPDLARSTLDVAAVWLASGLDPATAAFYRQSDVPELFELAQLLTNLTPKGLMNRAHAYKAARAANEAAGRDPDDGVNLGLFTYPILMAADILGPGADLVPVGKDQVQHLEMAADLARAANLRWGAGLKVPRPLVRPESALVVGTDGEKMSKSRGNLVPLVVSEADLGRLVRRVKTDSTGPRDPKEPGSNPLAAWYAAADPAGAADFGRRLREGRLSWGEAKDEVTGVLARVTGHLTQAYLGRRGDEAGLERTLAAGADRVRTEAARTLAEVRPGRDGLALSDYVPFAAAFRSVFATGRGLAGRTFTWGDRQLDGWLFPIDEGRAVGGLFQDVTEARDRQGRVVDQTRAVIRKNVEIVQKIAFLLGENAADTEAILNSILHTFGDQE